MKQLTFLLVLFLNGLSAFPQPDRLDSLLHSVIWNDKALKNFTDPFTSMFYIYGGFAGDSKTTYAGRELEQNMVLMNGSLYFFHPKGFFTGASGIWYGPPESRYNATIASAGISSSLNSRKTLHGRLSYSRFFNNNYDTVQYSFANNIGAGVSLRNKHLGARLSINLLFGEEFGFNATPAVFSKIALIKFGKSDMVQLEPEVSALLGSEIIELESNPLGSRQGSAYEPATHETYTVLNTQFYIPICIYIGDFDVEVGYSLNLPNSADKYYTYPSTSYFSFSLGYMISLN